MSGIKLNSPNGGSITVSTGNIAEDIVLDLSAVLESKVGSVNEYGQTVIGASDLISGTFLSYFTPPLFLIPRSPDTGTINFSNVYPVLTGNLAGQSVPFTLAQSDYDVNFINNSFRIGASETTGIQDIIQYGVVLGNVSVVDGNAVWNQPLSMTKNNAYAEIPVRYKTKTGTVIQSSISKIQFTFADYVTGAAGADAIAVSVPNGTHLFSADWSGYVSNYDNSGTDIYVYEGITPLTYTDQEPVLSGQWTLTTVETNIIRGPITNNNTYITIGNHSSFSTSSETALLSYTINGKTTNGNNFTINTSQTFNKVKAPVEYTVNIESTNGTIFRVGEARSTVLKARVFRNAVEITDELSSASFRWTRVSMDSKDPPYDDETWNSNYLSGHKQIEVGVDDIDAKATFHCQILI